MAKSPAEILSKKKPWGRPPRNVKYLRKITWDCRLRELRVFLKLSIGDVADAVKLSKTAYWQLEQGTDPMLTTACRVAAFFGMDVQAIWKTLAGGKK
jgi:DNA-binding XRE family transcriptional regulator